MGASEDAAIALAKALMEAWNSLLDSLFHALIDSMPRRVKALYDVKGWYTKY